MRFSESIAVLLGAALDFELSLIDNAGRQMKGTRLSVGNRNMIEKHQQSSLPTEHFLQGFRIRTRFLGFSFPTPLGVSIDRFTPNTRAFPRNRPPWRVKCNQLVLIPLEIMKTRPE